jgi:FixJ family two-component response regulator/anti-sigma regulatory factor (Ser/Thr protein kinase)
MLSLEAQRTVLAMDGDFLSRSFIEKVLTRAGYDVLTAATAAEAKNVVKRAGCGSLCCVVTDFALLENGGPDLLLWIAQEDSPVAVIATSGSSDKALVEQSLRGGACNFLNKPLDRFTLEQAVFEAAKLTRRNRRTLEIQRDVEQVGVVQRSLITSSIDRRSTSVGFCLHPKHEAGGDFFSHLLLPDGRSVALLTDVSGHELKSAFVSAYFQGIARAMLEAGLPLAAIFDRGNTFLLNESASREEALPVSIAVCAACVDEKNGQFEVLNSGAPKPTFVTATGECIAFRNSGSYPLGWFPEMQVDCDRMPIVPGQLVLWTDGVQDLADEIGISAAAVACALTLARQAGHEPSWLAMANDDILVATWKIGLPDPCDKHCGWYLPILTERYTPDRLGDIDEIQAFLVNSIRFAVPPAASETLHDIALCAREALLNALKYGCTAAGAATLQLTYAPERQTFTMVVEDDGPGHQFACDEHAAIPTTQLTPGHRGLFLMRALSVRFKSERRGAKLTMDFVCKENLDGKPHAATCIPISRDSGRHS